MRKELLEGFTDEQIARVKKCDSKKVKTKYNENSINEWYSNDCQECGFHWNVDA